MSSHFFHCKLFSLPCTYALLYRFLPVHFLLYCPPPFLWTARVCCHSLPSFPRPWAAFFHLISSSCLCTHVTALHETSAWQTPPAAASSLLPSTPLSQAVTYSFIACAVHLKHFHEHFSFLCSRCVFFVFCSVILSFTCKIPLCCNCQIPAPLLSTCRSFSFTAICFSAACSTVASVSSLYVCCLSWLALRCSTGTWCLCHANHRWIQ